MTTMMHTFESGAELALALATAVADKLSEAVAEKGTASIAVSGGSTPKGFFRALSEKPIDWEKVAITLVDERFVPEDNPRSNHKLVKENLLVGPAAAARFIPLYQAVNTAEEAAEIVTNKVSAASLPFDVVVLGMGTDGHTASFFPGGDTLGKALDMSTPAGVMAMHAEGAGEARLTFTFSSLENAGLLVLHVEGAEKKEVLEKALDGNDEAEMPIRAVLKRATSPVDIYWAP
ncbi:6-phosphogluconolactonase [Martelella endophytica]|uniref:6-phosphogluconolactonase n=1 Tax=Martelella endophytica TaxID=1486262 RepID=A0A0D5LMC9_MAREN|nr:6-phosphogluconolactonase [Martelella endophytica]AJY44458.1 6-phosphogluconolactonase [Martelella endophytica]